MKKEQENPQLKALKTLIAWIIGLAILFGVVYLVNYISNTVEEPKTNETTKPEENKPEDQEDNTTITYQEKLHDLINNGYTFEYIITKNGEKIKYEGIKSQNKMEGYKQTVDGIIKFKIENQKVYQVLLDKIVEYGHLFDDIDASLLDLSNIMNLINQIRESDIIVTEEDQTTYYTYHVTNEENLEITIAEQKENIQKITIHRENETYELNYR